MIPYGRQDIQQADIDAVVEVLRSEWLTQGPVVPRFESVIADNCGANYAIATNSATSALHLSCLALGLGPGDWLWTSPNSFVASANCALYCGAQVDFVDIDPQTYNLCVEALEHKLRQAAVDGRLPKIIVPVHFAGQSCDMAKIHALSQRYGFKIIEDASHAIGGRYREGAIGSCRYSDVTIFSFHPVKIITTGEGGMALTNDPALSEKMALLRSHGITRDPTRMTQRPDGPWYYQQTDLGYNYRMTDIQAALGISQLARLEAFVERRNELASRYKELLIDLPVTLPWVQPDCYSSFHLYVIRFKFEKIDKSYIDIFDALLSKGIGVNLHYIPIHTQPWYQKMGFKAGDFPEAVRYYGEAISLPIFQSMSDQQQDKVAKVLREVLKT